MSSLVYRISYLISYLVYLSQVPKKWVFSRVFKCFHLFHINCHTYDIQRGKLWRHPPGGVFLKFWQVSLTKFFSMTQIEFWWVFGAKLTHDTPIKNHFWWVDFKMLELSPQWLSENKKFLPDSALQSLSQNFNIFLFFKCQRRSIFGRLSNDRPPSSLAMVFIIWLAWSTNHKKSPTPRNGHKYA